MHLVPSGDLHHTRIDNAGLQIYNKGAEMARPFKARTPAEVVDDLRSDHP